MSRNLLPASSSHRYQEMAQRPICRFLAVARNQRDQQHAAVGGWTTRGCLLRYLCCGGARGWRGFQFWEAPPVVASRDQLPVLAWPLPSFPRQPDSFELNARSFTSLPPRQTVNLKQPVWPDNRVIPGVAIGLGVESALQHRALGRTALRRAANIVSGGQARSCQISPAPKTPFSLGDPSCWATTQLRNCGEIVISGTVTDSQSPPTSPVPAVPNGGCGVWGLCQFQGRQTPVGEQLLRHAAFAPPHSRHTADSKQRKSE